MTGIRNDGTTMTGSGAASIRRTLLAASCMVIMGAANAQTLSPDVALKAAGVDNEEVAISYYNTIDPDDERTTQDDWEEVNGFNDPANTVITVSGYKNEGDLGDFYRLIQMVVDERDGFEGNIAFTTANYLEQQDAIDDALNGNFLLSASIVNMEFSPGPEEDELVKFYVYDGEDGTRQKETTFSEGGESLFMPAACYSCHGGDDDAEGADPEGYNEGSGETNSSFLAFDTSTMSFNGNLLFNTGAGNVENASRAELEAVFKMYNEAILHADPTRATKTLVKGLYGGSGLPLDVQDTDYLPADWAAGSAEDIDFYRRVVVPSCRLCHTTSDKKLLKLSYWKDNPGKIRDSVFDEAFMPNAVPTYEKLINDNDLVQLLLNTLDRYEAE